MIWWRLWTCLIGWQANSTSKKKQYKISFVSGSESSKKKQLFQKGNLPNQPPWNGWFLRVSNGFNPPWTFSLPLCAPKIRVGSWCPLASGLGQKRGQDALKIPWRLPKRDPLPGWWFQPIWKKLVKMGIFPNMGEHKNYLKPPPRWPLTNQLTVDVTDIGSVFNMPSGGHKISPGLVWQRPWAGRAVASTSGR